MMTEPGLLSRFGDSSIVSLETCCGQIFHGAKIGNKLRQSQVARFVAGKVAGLKRTPICNRRVPRIRGMTGLSPTGNL